MLETYSISTYPDDRVEFRHGDLLGALDGRGDLLLVLLRQERQHLPHDGRHPLDDLGLKWTTSIIGITPIYSIYCPL